MSQVGVWSHLATPNMTGRMMDLAIGTSCLTASGARDTNTF